MEYLPNRPNTQLAVNGIIAILQSATYTDATPVYSQYTFDDGTTTGAVFEGGFGDVSDAVPCASVVASEDDSEHKAFGGMIEETYGFVVTSLVKYNDKKTAQQQIIAIRDAVIPLFQQHATLQGLLGVDDSRVKPQSAKYGFYMDTKTYRGHQFTVQVNYKYVLLNGVQQ